MSAVTADVRGVEALKKRMGELAYAGASRASGKAIRKGMKVVAQAQAAALPAKTGALKRSVGSRVMKNAGRNNITRAKAGMNVGKGKPVAKGSKERKANYAPHAHLFALGTVPRWAGVELGRRTVGRKRVYDESRDTLTGKKVAYRGIMPANAAIKRATAGAEPAAINAITETLRVEIAREAAKAGGR